MVKNKSKKGKRKQSAGRSGKGKPGKKPLSPGEPTERNTVNLPASIYAEVMKRVEAKDLSFSGYIRELVENDLRKAG